MTQRQQAALETRRKITEEGLALVRRGGFAGASVEAITRAAGVAKGTFYVHFPTKEHLAAELCREPYEALSREVLASAGPLRRRLGRLFRGWAEIAEASGVEIAREWFRIAVRPAEAAELGLVWTPSCQSGGHLSLSAASFLDCFSNSEDTYLSFF